MSLFNNIKSSIRITRRWPWPGRLRCPGPTSPVAVVAPTPWTQASRWGVPLKSGERGTPSMSPFGPTLMAAQTSPLPAKKPKTRLARSMATSKPPSRTPSQPTPRTTTPARTTPATSTSPQSIPRIATKNAGKRSHHPATCRPSSSPRGRSGGR